MFIKLSIEEVLFYVSLKKNSVSNFTFFLGNYATFKILYLMNLCYLWIFFTFFLALSSVACIGVCCPHYFLNYRLLYSLLFLSYWKTSVLFFLSIPWCCRCQEWIFLSYFCLFNLQFYPVSCLSSVSRERQFSFPFILVSNYCPYFYFFVNALCMCGVCVYIYIYI